jgi:hypothetical protein
MALRLCARIADSSTSAVTKGLPSRSPPIQEPGRRKAGNSARPCSRQPATVARQVVFAGVVEARQFAQESHVVERERVVHLVHHGQLGPAQHACLPQAQHGAAQGFVMLGLLFGRQFGAVALIQQSGDFPLRIEDALALHLGRMGGQHRPHLGAGEEPGELPGV